MTAAQVLERVLADCDFYGEEGGLTVSGGEPLLQPEFVLELGRLAKEEGLHICLETSGAVPFRVLEQVAPVVDLFLYDVKDTDEERHLQNVGVPLSLPRENLCKLDAMGKKTLLRCPIIPGINDREEHFAALGQLRRSLANCAGIQLMPYHDLGRGKEGRFGTVTEAFRVPGEEEKALWQQTLEQYL
jgi:pyruvate formate lyase activating enzyme